MTNLVEEETVFQSLVRFGVLPFTGLDKLQAGSATPSVKNLETWLANNSVPVTITDFLFGAENQVIYILGDNFTSVANNANIKTDSGSTELLLSGIIYTFHHINGIWYENVTGALQYNLKKFGAVGDGVAIDTTPFSEWQLAIGGKFGIIPAGTYKVGVEFLINVAATKIFTMGDVTFLFTGVTHGLRIDALRCVINGLITLRAGNAGCLSAFKGDNNASYLSIYNVFVDCAAAAGWLIGHEHVNTQNFCGVGGWVNGNTGNGIPKLYVVRDTSRVCTYLGASGTGHGGGVITTDGVRVEDSGELSWHGGVMQGGFAVGGFNIDGNGNAPQVHIHSCHVEQSAGAGFGYRYDNSGGSLNIHGSIGGTVDIGPIAAAYDCQIEGGVFPSIKINAFSRNAKINPSQVGAAITEVAGHSGTKIGQYRIVGQVIPVAEISYRTRLRESVLVFAANVTTDCSKGTYFTLTVSTNGNFQIDNPINPQVGQELQYDIFNNTAAMGVLTWGTEFKLDGAFVNPANGQHRIIRFYRTSANLWRELYRAAADQPN